jgi:hypothetical protein
MDIVETVWMKLRRTNLRVNRVSDLWSRGSHSYAEVTTESKALRLLRTQVAHDGKSRCAQRERTLQMARETSMLSLTLRGDSWAP